MCSLFKHQKMQMTKFTSAKFQTISPKPCHTENSMTRTNSVDPDLTGRFNRHLIMSSL